MPTIATCEVTLPKPAAQSAPAIAPHVKRVVTTVGTTANSNVPIDVAVDSTAPVVVKAEVGTKVAVRVQEVLGNGRVSPGVVLEFIPRDHIEPIDADGSQFYVQTTSVEEVP